jgi:O-antigen/teichoic acid export membrane protein
MQHRRARRGDAAWGRPAAVAVRDPAQPTGRELLVSGRTELPAPAPPGRRLTVVRRLGGFTLAVALNGIVATAVIPVLITTVGLADWAGLATGQAIGGTAALVLAWGWGVVGPAEVAAMPLSERPPYYTHSLQARLFLAPPVTVVAALVALIVVRGDVWAGVLMAVAMTLQGLNASWYFIGCADPRGFLLWDTTPRLAATVIGVTAVAFGAPLATYPILLVVAALGATSGASRRITGRPLARPTIARSVGWRHFRSKGSSVVATLLASTYLALPLVFVSALAPAAAPVYALADRLLRLATTALSPLSQLTQGWVPAGPPSELRSRIRRAISAISVVAAVAGSALALGGPWAGNILSGLEVRLPLSVTAPMGLALAATLITQTIGLACLVPLRKQAYLLYAAAGGAAVNLALQLLLVPRLGASGASWAVAAAEGAVLCIELSALVRRPQLSR